MKFRARCLLFGSLLASSLGAQAQPTTGALAERAARRAAIKDPKLHAAIGNGLQWLQRSQAPAGCWRGQDHGGSGGHDIGLTGLAVLALLGNADPAHHESVRRAATWLTGQFDAKGSVPAKSHDYFYSQAIAVLALLDASEQLRDDALRTVAEGGLVSIWEHRNPEAAWRYQPRGGDSDTSVTGWCLEVMHCALAAGIEVPPAAVAIPMAWLQSVTKPDGYTGYDDRHTGSSRLSGDHALRFPWELGATLPAIGLRCRAQWGLSGATPADRGAIGILLARVPTSVPAARDFYYWFHASEAMHLAGDARARRTWDAALHGALLPLQVGKGELAGCWRADDAWGEVGGRVGSTSLALLALQAPWRVRSDHLLAPVPVTGPLAPVRKLVEEGRYSAAQRALQAFPDDDSKSSIVVGLRRLRWVVSMAIVGGEHRVRRIEVDEPDKLLQLETLTELAHSLEGLPGGDLAERRRNAMISDPKVAPELDAARELRDIRSKMSSGKPASAAQRARLQRLMERWPSTNAADMARRLLGG